MHIKISSYCKLLCFINHNYNQTDDISQNCASRWPSAHLNTSRSILATTLTEASLLYPMVLYKYRNNSSSKETNAVLCLDAMHLLYIHTILYSIHTIHIRIHYTKHFHAHRDHQILVKLISFSLHLDNYY